MKIEKPNPDQTEQHAQKQHEKKRVLVGSSTIRPGHRCFEINTLTEEIKEANYKIAATFGSGVKRSVDIKENCVYIMALNKNNALKKYRKS